MLSEQPQNRPDAIFKAPAARFAPSLVTEKVASIVLTLGRCPYRRWRDYGGAIHANRPGDGGYRHLGN